MAIHPDNRHIVAGGRDGTIRIWDIGIARRPRVLRGHSVPVRCVAISRDGRSLASGDDGHAVRLWDLSAGRSRALQGHEAGLRSVAFSPDGRHLLSTDASGRIVQWDVASGAREFGLLHEHAEASAQARQQPGTSPGSMADYTPDGRRIVSASLDEWIMIWDVATRELLEELHGQSNILGFSISGDGRRMAVADQTASIKVYDLDHLQADPLTFPGNATRNSDVVISPDGRALASVDRNNLIRLQDSRTGQTFDLFEGTTAGVQNCHAFSPDGRMLATVARNEIHLRRLTRETGGITLVDGLGPVRRMAASADGRRLALARDDDRIIVCDAATGRAIQTLDGHDLGIFGLAFVPIHGDPRLVSVGGDGLVRIWDTDAGGPPKFTLPGHQGAVYAVAVRPDGRQVATGGQDGFVRTWDPATGRPDLAPIDHGAAVSALAYDPGGGSLASGGMDRSVSAWSTASGRRRLGPMEHHGALSCLAYSPDGTALAGGGSFPDRGGGVTLWGTWRGDVRANIETPRGVDGLSFSPDGQRLATCGADAVVQLWDTSSGQETLTLQGHTLPVACVLFAPRGLQLYSTGPDGVVKLWEGGER